MSVRDTVQSCSAGWPIKDTLGCFLSSFWLLPVPPRALSPLVIGRFSLDSSPVGFSQSFTDPLAIALSSDTRSNGSTSWRMLLAGFRSNRLLPLAAPSRASC
jgi:hypothetical protein